MLSSKSSAEGVAGSGMEKWRGAAHSLDHAPQLSLAVQVLDLGRNYFGPKLPNIALYDLAIVQVAVDPDEPGFGAFLDYFPGQFPKRDNEVPLDIFFVAKRGIGGHVKGSSVVIGSEEGCICGPRLPVRITRLLLYGIPLMMEAKPVLPGFSKSVSYPSYSGA